MTSPEVYAVAGAVVAVALLYKLIIYPVLLSPLSKVPAAHPLAAVTSLWIQWHRWQRTDLQCIEHAFARNGPYIRLGPEEMCVNTKAAAQSIYGVGAQNFDKHKSYDHFITHGCRNMFSATGKEHAYYRKRIAGVYVASFLQTSPHIRAIMRNLLLERLLPIFDKTAKSGQGSMDVIPIFNSYAFDFMTSFQFGLPRGTNMLQDEREREEWFNWHTIFSDPAVTYWLMEHPKATKLLRAIGVPMVPRNYYETAELLDEWTTKKVRESEKAIQKSKEAGIPFPDGELPVMCNSIRSSMADEAGVVGEFKPTLSQELEIASECLDHLYATRDVSGAVVSFILYEICRHPEAQDELRRELLSIDQPFYYHQGMTAAGPLPSASALQKLPFLNAVIKESLRLRNNAPLLDARVTPPNRKSTVGTLKDLPPGLRVGAYAWLLHHDDGLYPDAQTWNPWRWMRGGSNKSGWYFAFSGGSRRCVGQHVAWELMRLAIAGIYSNYRTTIFDESEYPGTKGFVSIKCDVKLFVKFERLSV